MKILFVAVASVFSLTAAEYRVGVAKLDITPSEPIYLSGYAARTRPFDGVFQRIWAKALAIEGKKQDRVVIVTTDLIGLPRSVSDIVAAEVQKRYGLARSQVVLNSSHTHTGPYLHNNLMMLFDLPEKDLAPVRAYTTKLTEDLVSVIGAALREMQPAELRFGNGEVRFGINRRQRTAKEVQIGVNEKGPTDPDVPVLEVRSPDGKTRAVLFGYACHNTTLTAEFNQVSGDYAGYAQEGIERDMPGTTALFMMLCGGDQNPNPRSTLELAKQHGATLAAEVRRVVDGKMQPVRGNIRSAFQTVELRFAHHTREQYEARLKETNVYRVRHAKAMLRAYDEGRPMRSYQYPVQAVAIGKDFALLALGGEVVVDYVLRTKKEYGAKGMMVAGYSNDVMAYIPSLRVLKEGGYEADTSMIYYGPPGPWAEDVEERIFNTIHTVLRRVGKKPLK